MYFMIDVASAGLYRSKRALRNFCLGKPARGPAPADARRKESVMTLYNSTRKWEEL